MYSPKIVEQSLAKFAKSGHKLVRNDIPTVEDWTERLAKLWDADSEGPKRKFTPDESAFVTNERLMCSIDFSYWCERYAWILLDKGGLGRLTLWGSQRLLLDYIIKLEEEMYDKASRGEPVDGILIALHKARQLGATMFSRAVIMHRVTTTPYTRAITASIDDEKVDALSLRDKRILDNLPWWLRPTTGWDVKGHHRTFPMLDCSLTYQKFTQTGGGIGQGEQFEMGHMTEVASFMVPERMEHDYFPAIPQSTLALHILESTPQGRGNWWHDFITSVRRGDTPRWKFVYWPYYVEPSKYRRTPPEGWKPSEVSLHHAHKVYDTSVEYTGKRMMLPLDVLYWWETTREEYARKGLLNIFLTNYSATIEESFQHTSASAFDPSLLEHFRSLTGDGLAMEFRQMEK